MEEGHGGRHWVGWAVAQHLLTQLSGKMWAIIPWRAPWVQNKAGNIAGLCMAPIYFVQALL